ncbi:hypothetical protein T4D_3991 [Trichinella pseudospiralis]|uniref:Uncharacterized protein n=1 Tax=Trichinella pseudospiralis TaxID=6337 RepID=A0A0V1G564_TRIPS|nr:hypothetical protein T4D_3991 [Trichinella pseudospiralis]
MHVPIHLFIIQNSFEVHRKVKTNKVLLRLFMASLIYSVVKQLPIKKYTPMYYAQLRFVSGNLLVCKCQGLKDHCFIVFFIYGCVWIINPRLIQGYSIYRQDL